MPNRPRTNRSARLASVAVALIGVTLGLFGDFSRVLSQPPHAFAQTGDKLTGATPDYDSEPNLAELLEAIKHISLTEPLPGLVVGAADYPAFGLRVHVFDFEQARYTLRVVEQKAATGNRVADFLSSEDDVFVINGGFFERAFDGTLSPSGYLIADSVATSQEHDRAGSGIIYSDEDGVAITYRKELGDRSRIGNAVQVGPILVDPGGIKGIYKNAFDRYNRSAVCLRGRSFTAIVVEGGISLFQFADLLSLPASEGGIGCNVAINLDGGPSTQALLLTGKVRREIAGGTAVQNALVVSRKPAP